MIGEKVVLNQDKMEINSMFSKVRELNTAQLATVRPQDVRMLSLQDFLRLEKVLVLKLTFVIYIADQVRECEKVFLLNHCSPTRSGTKPSGTSLSPFDLFLSLDFFIKDSSGLLHGEREVRNLQMGFILVSYKKLSKT